VYMAQARDGTLVAVKVLRKELSGQRDMLGRFQREAVLLQRVQHPNVVKLIECVDAPEGLLLVMEWAQGERLDSLRLEPAEVKVVLAQLADALAAIHAAGIVHRDLKPENVMVQRTPHLHAWLLDLGIARFQHARDAVGNFVTMTGQGAGTASCISPEQIRGEAPDPRSDVYSFGVLAYRLLTGRLPFDAQTDMEMMEHHLRSVPRPPTVSDPSLAGLEWLVVQCLEKKREARPSDGTSLLDALKHAGSKRKTWWPF
jgi:serine/threonine protein kinase, bacterial